MAAAFIPSTQRRFSDMTRMQSMSISPALDPSRTAEPSSLAAEKRRVSSGNMSPYSPPTHAFHKGRYSLASTTTSSSNAPTSIPNSSPMEAMTGPPDPAKEHICLCAPKPKIPRPRNAFILYRQNHQAQVAAQNPGLANPDISKIIGIKWKEEPPHVREEWKELAEKEKAIHAKQHPGYRYQPKRNKTSLSGKPLGDDSGPCPVCGGRYIATPRTPSTPYPHNTGAETSSYLTSADMDNDPYHRASFGGPGRPPPYDHSHHIAYRDARTHEPEHEGAASPISDPKRRRLNSGAFQPMSPPAGVTFGYGPRHVGRPSMNGSTPDGPSSYSSSGYGPLPSLSGAPRQGMGTPMQPPPRPSISYIPPHRAATFDESLRLPPLQTQGHSPLSPSTTEISSKMSDKAGQSQPSSSREQQARSVEAMVMTIPYLSKFKVLAKISPPIATPGFGPENPPRAMETRGALIAIEGPRCGLLDAVSKAIEGALVSSGQVSLKKWSDDTPGIAGDVGVNEEGATRHLDFAGYLKLMVQWHEKSQQIVQHITTKPATTQEATAPEEGTSTPKETATDGTSTPAPPSTPTLDKGRSTIPVALVPRGFSLTSSDKFACAVPIADKYAPVDHWQWMATIWRGVVGPDLVVYVKPSTVDEIRQLGPFELKIPGIMVVRIAEGSSLDDMTERRIAFEVREWVLGGSYKRAAAIKE